MKASLNGIPAALFLSGMIALGGCQEAGQPGEAETDSLAADTAMQGTAQQQTAVAQLEPTEGNTARGTIRFVPTDGELEVSGMVTGLEPESEHGIHIHQNGDCSNNAEAAGPHWPGMSTQHGSPDDPMEERHAGDLGNLEADETGTAEFERTIDFTMPLDSLANKAVVVHAQPDDFETQPSGNSGARIACGVIELVTGPGMGTDTTGMGGDTADTDTTEM